MTDLANLTTQLAARRDLAPDETAAAAVALASVEVGEEPKKAFLRALADKGETAAEIAGFAKAYRGVAIDPGLGKWADRAIDVVGTGGDHAGGFNISSLVVLTLASAGVPVMKHGNRGITSACGSADLLAGLGVDIQAPPEKLRQAMDQLGYVFLFAPAYHPAFKHIAPVRKALAAEGRRSVFNLLGPLINPGRPGHILLGVFSEDWVARLAGALETLGTGAGLAAHGVIGPGKGIDELTTATDNTVRGIGRLASIKGTWKPEDYGLVRARFDELKGGDVAANLAIVDSLLAGRGPKGLVDTIALNAAVALWIVGATPGVREGIARAREQLLGGAVKAKIAATREFYGKR